MTDKPTNDAEWRARLTPEQYRILREAGTEPPCSGALLNKSRWKASILLVLATAVVGCLLVATAVNAPMFLAGIGIGGAIAAAPETPAGL